MKKTDGCNSPVIYYEELVDTCKSILQSILINRDDLIKEVYKMLNEIRTSKDYKLEIKKQEDNIIKIKNDLTEYNTLKEDLDKGIKQAEELKLKLLEEQKGQISSNQFETFKNKVSNIVFDDDEKILKIASTLFEDIKVENIKSDESKYKVILHAKLNILDKKDKIFDLDKFLLLFCKGQGCVFGDCKGCTANLPTCKNCARFDKE